MLALADYRELELLPDTHPMLVERMPEFDFDKQDAKTVRDMLIHALLRFDGFGLAANQIGLKYRAFAMNYHGRPTVFFNPVITELSAETVLMEEGCLSFPNLKLKIKRPATCRLIYSDSNGNRQTLLLDDWHARCALHEVDHLNGVVFTSKVSRLKLQMAIKKA